MKLSTLSHIELPATADMHVHLRAGPMMSLVTPLIKDGGVDTVYVMPNLVPPITTVKHAVAYHDELKALAPDVQFLMSLYLHKSITPETIAEAKTSGVVHGVKFYPAGVTTNSDSGVLDIEQFYPVFAAMQEHDLVLNLHGEMTSTPSSAFTKGDREAVTVLNAEPMFLPQLKKLHKAFPRLRIVLEHVSTRAGLEAVKRCGSTVAATITAHHLLITIDDWTNDVHSFCKPVAKTPADRVALVRAVAEGSGKFFFGSDSAPHPVSSKKGYPAIPTAAGCFTQPFVTSLVLSALEEGIEKDLISEEDVKQDAIEGFLSAFGRRFYGLPASGGQGKGKLRMVKKGDVVPEIMKSSDVDGVEVVPFGRGRAIWSVEWLN